jgi:MMP 1-O-methyltransferase
MLKQLKQSTDKIEGWLNPLEGVSLYKFVEQSPNPNIVEVGSWKGKSTAWLLVAAKVHTKHLFVIDHFRGSSEHQKGLPNGINTYPEFCKNIETIKTEYDIPNRHLSVMKMNSLDAAKRFKDESVGMIFIDASHEYEDIKSDLQAWIPKICPEGIIAVHDCNWFGVNKALLEVCPENTKQVASIAWWKK